MKSIINKGIVAAGICVMSLQTANACWDSAGTNALKIKHLNTMLMATALRCRNTNSDFLPHYNAFVQKHNALLGQQNTIVRLHLAKTLGNGDAIARSDNLSVRYANAYGAGHQSMDCAQLKVFAADIASRPSDVKHFSLLADEVLHPTDAPGAICKLEPTKIASK